MPADAWRALRHLLTRDRPARGASTEREVSSQRVRALSESVFFDDEYYAECVGERFGSRVQAAEHAVERGMPALCGWHPLVTPATLPREARLRWRAKDVDGVLEHLGSASALSRPWGALFDPRLLGAGEAPTSAEVEEFFATLDAADPVLPVVPVGGRPAPRWAAARAAALAAAREVRAPLAAAAAPASEPAGAAVPRAAGHLSVVLVERGRADVSRTLRAIRSLAADARDRAVDVVVVDASDHDEASRALGGALGALGAARWLRVPSTTGAHEALLVGVAATASELVMLLDHRRLTARPGWSGAMLDAMAEADVRGAQPVVVDPTDVIVTAGLVFPGEDDLPVHHLSGHPLDDARSVSGVPFAALSSRALVVRAAELVAVPVDPAATGELAGVGLCLDLVERFGGAFRVAPEAVLELRPARGGAGPTHDEESWTVAERRHFLGTRRGALPGPEGGAYAAAGLQMTALGRREDDGDPAPPRPVLVRCASGADGAPRPPRWNVKHAASPGPAGRRWGDTHFADALADALRGLGQEVVVSPRGAHDAPATVHDDVVLAIRGTERVRPQPGCVNVLWVISHPDEVTVPELQEFDLVFAASQQWAEEKTREAGREVLPLLQAADTRRFYPPSAAAPRDGGIVFVGQARLDAPRAIVMDVVAAGGEPRVWGPRWERHLPGRLVQGDYFANEDLGDLYRSADVVLNDHWSDMAAHGFMSNRLFDAAACAAAVLSDPIAGAENFGGLVRTYSGPDELAAILDARGHGFPDADERLAIAHDVVARHSFSARAVTLLEAVVQHRESK